MLVRNRPIDEIMEDTALAQDGVKICVKSIGLDEYKYQKRCRLCNSIFFVWKINVKYHGH